MKVLLAITGSEGEGFLRRVVMLAALDHAEDIVLAHVIDTKHRAEVEFGRERFFTRHAVPEGRSADLTQAEEERARAGMRFARQALIDAGVSESRLRDIMVRGKPNEELCRLANEEKVDLIVVGGRGGKPGPHSIGKTARFVLDHAPSSVLLIR